MADIQYLNYGDLQIELLALLTSLANNVQSYVAKQPWSNKRKEKFMSAYSDIMNNGLLGASNTSGQWTIDVGGTIDLDSKSKKDKEMYLEAAYFIQQQMSKLPTKSSLEKKDESELPKYDSFINNFSNYLSQTYYGGNPIRTQEDWNILDERNPNTGLRGTDKRVKRLSDYLKAYSSSLEEGKYNFEGSPFKDLTDLKTRINNAITKLDDGTWNLDDADALNAIGLRSSDWFNNGSGDPVTLEDRTTTTYGLLAEYNRKVAEAKKKLEEADKIAKLKAIRATQYTNFKFHNIGKLNGKPLSGGKDLNYLNGLASKGNLTPDELSELVGAFKLAERTGNLLNLSKEELLKFGSRYINNPNRLKKIDKLNGFYLDTIGNRIIQPSRGALKNDFNEVLKLNSPEALALKKESENLKLRELYAKRTEMTPQDWEYVASIVPDIASIPDPEPYSAAALAFTGAGMRHHALANRPGGMSSSDKLWQLADYVGAGLAAIPGFGDAYLVGRILNTTRKFATGLFAAAGMYGLGASTVNAFKKYANGEDMTLQEKMDVVMAIPSLVSAYRLHSREGLNEAAKAANQSSTSTNKGKVKVTITDEGGNKTTKEITGISELKAKNLQKQFKDAGNDNTKKAQILKADNEIKTKAQEQNIDLNKISIETDSRKFASYRKPAEIEIYQETTPSSARTRYNLEITNLENSGKNWQARRLRIYDKFYRGTGGPRNESNGNWLKRAWNYVTNTKNLEFANRIKNGESTNNQLLFQQQSFAQQRSGNLPLLLENSPLPNILSPLFNIQRPIKEPKLSNLGKKNLNEFDESFKVVGDFERAYGLNGKNGPMSEGFGGNNIKSGTITLDVGGEKITLKINPSLLKGINRNEANFNGKVAEIRGTMAKQLNSLFKKMNINEKADAIRKLKKKGWLKQGGTIDKQKIQQYKEFIKK